MYWGLQSSSNTGGTAAHCSLRGSHLNAPTQRSHSPAPAQQDLKKKTETAFFPQQPQSHRHLLLQPPALYSCIPRQAVLLHVAVFSLFYSFAWQPRGSLISDGWHWPETGGELKPRLRERYKGTTWLYLFIPSRTRKPVFNTTLKDMLMSLRSFLHADMILTEGCRLWDPERMM